MPSSLSRLEDEGLKLIMLGGKGGVGKTTCAAATALHFAETGKKTLIISSDPTPSLSDIFEIPIGDSETPIPGAPGLHAIEISSQMVLEMWRQRFGTEIYAVLSSFADLGYEFVDYVGTAPGIEEEYMLSYILDMVEGDHYDLVIWDTAPAGHTMRLLTLPNLFLNHLEAATKFYLNIYGYYEKVRDSVRLQRGKKSILEIIRSWEDLAERIIRFLRDEDQTAFVLVTIPEALGVKQTQRLVRDFNQHGLSVRHLIVNHVIQDADCPFHLTRKRMQAGYLRTLEEEYAAHIPMIIVPESPLEVKGMDRIRDVSGILFQDQRS